MQCRRKGIVCHGYRDTSQLRVRDETNKIIEKYNNKQTHDKNSPQMISIPDHHQGHLPLSNLEAHHANKAPGCARGLSPDARETATTYFMQLYILASPFHDYLPELYTRSCSEDENPLSSAVHAASLATFNLHTGAETQLQMGLKEYSVALARTNLCLADTQTAISNETLASVLLLGLFEAIVFQGGKSPEQWIAHTDGALRLLQVRGRRNVESKTAALLYTQTCSIVRASYIQRSAPMPIELLQLDAELMPYFDLGSAARRLNHVTLGQILNETARIRARVSGCSSREIILDALKADQQAQELIERLRDELPYTVSPAKLTTSWACLSVAHKYPNPRVAKLYNSVRLVRFFLNHLIWYAAAAAERNGLEANDADFYAPIQEAAINNATVVGNDILNSIPGFMTQQESGTSAFLPSARTLAWPLALLRKSPIFHASGKSQAQMLLGTLGECLRIPQIIHAPDQVQQEEDW